MVNIFSRKVLTCTKSSTVILSRPFSFTASLQAIFTCAMCIFFFLANIQTIQLRYMYSEHRKYTHHHSNLSCSSFVTCPFPCQQLIVTLRIVDSVCVCACYKNLDLALIPFMNFWKKRNMISQKGAGRGVNGRSEIFL